MRAFTNSTSSHSLSTVCDLSLDSRDANQHDQTITSAPSIWLMSEIRRPIQLEKKIDIRKL